MGIQQVQPGDVELMYVCRLECNLYAADNRNVFLLALRGPEPQQRVGNEATKVRW
jgi:hypothetical protein